MRQQFTVARAVPAGIAADDLTGATDSAVQFARDGWQARLTLAPTRDGGAAFGSVVAVVTDARAQSQEDARASTAEAVTGLREAGARRIFVKIDSTMRGSVLGQLRGALDAWSSEHPGAFAVVCPAYPAMGRTVEAGELLVHGAGVHTGPAGTDPVTPVTTSAFSELLPGSVALRLGAESAASNAAMLEAAGAGGRTVVVDAVADADLARLAEAVALLGPRAIPVGAAGLAAAMSHVWSAARASRTDDERSIRRIVVVVSSLHEVSRAQAEHLLQALPADRVRRLAPSLDDVLRPQAIAAWAQQQLDASPELPEVVVVASPLERPSQETGAPSTAERVAESLATITAQVFDRAEVDAVMLLGGEGARAVLGRLGTTSLLIRDAIREGIPLGVLEGGTADGAMVVTKAGGFGEITSVTGIVQELLHP
ncbi:four-carbon acid sugar kinase family protein [Agrococcus baldri]|uniref:Four-carbon acid sugar kinase family protein n=1 Tax=Agrococcus baldri TaxID=153730 RepID=A0AA87UQY1_9MICO|nr:four-carbon acid sugar kinase family protein [Agrococcus baldri]GEK79168.1 hypothetical protein ABA31_05190 [Agrococcus baldri]